MSRVRLAEIELPDFDMPEAMPELEPQIYADRLDLLRERMAERGLTRLLIYADREHSANAAYLTGFDPRFEEALLIIAPHGEPAILVGNENWGTAGAAGLSVRRHMFQDFSLPSQPRNQSRALADILAEEGVGEAARIGLVGWKSYARPQMSDLPAYLVDAVRDLAGSDDWENATDIFIAAANGLRVINEVDQLAAMEWAACQTSEGVKRLLFNLRPGMTEHQAVALLGWPGTPLSCHLMLTAGPRARFGLLSPSDRPIGRAEPFTTAYGIWGALNCRAGWTVEDASELPGSISDYVERLAAPYFEAVVEWLEALHVGQTGGNLDEIVARRLGDPFFGIFLNAGHQISLDEWVNSPVWPGSQVQLRSGMALQVDIIPATGTDYFTTNIEDTLCLADSTLRESLAQRYPGAWARIEARRDFMTNSLGIKLHPDVLPFSNIPAYLPPFILAPNRALTVA